ncbi:SH3 domain-containing protein [Rummeliibacillus suwonensis]|uniref:SH3 domain-containing protein n=1 Tax=Rummeliibacillus suwonensis TaxID=1306154 RepID=UPI001AAE5A61|nr:SH3 domain-containing protein [Rummeliibacillus suwonensis]MBO2537034.1 SH3 domain-containing protein [Rummeliibacillus suwonensis]
MKIVKVLLSFMVTFGTLTFFIFSTNSDAATTNTVNAKVANSVYVHLEPSANAKRIGTLWKGDKVVVYSQSKTGWAKIKFHKKTAYVYSSYLIFSPKTSSPKNSDNKTNTPKQDSLSTSQKTSYRPVTTNIYYYIENGQKGKMFSSNKRNSTGWTYWYKKTSTAPKQIILIRESSNGLDYRFAKIGTVRQIIYPFTKDQVFKTNHKSYKVVSISNKFTVKAGTFKSVVGIKGADGSITYYAPNAGAIKIVKNKKVIYEVTKIISK